VQPLWRDAQSAHFSQPSGVYNAPTAPLTPPPEPGYWVLHSVQPLQLFGEPKLLVVWTQHAPIGAGTLGGVVLTGDQPLRRCTVCLALRRHREACYVATGPEGLQWFECDGHQAYEHGSIFGEDTSARTLTPLKEWLTQAVGL
jgi:hypothetical protein